MDQNAFRTLLSAPRAQNGESSKRVLGGPAPKRGWGIKSKSGKEYEKKDEPQHDGPAFAPRAHQKKSQVQDKYKDRAEMRRQGVEDEYKPVEKLLEDLEKRAEKDEGYDIDKARQYLGGDVEHSILVKGLDYSLLAARKAELARENEDIADEELDALLGGEKVKPKKAEKVTAKEETLGKGFKSIGAKAEPEKKKKKKKKKNVKLEPPVDTQTPAGDKDHQVEKTKSPSQAVERPEVNPIAVERMALVAPVVEKVESETEQDIFGDVGGYDLNAGQGDNDSSSDSDTEEKTAGASTRQAARRSLSSESESEPARNGRGIRRRRDSDDSGDRYDGDHRGRGASRDRDGYYRRYGDDPRDSYGKAPRQQRRSSSPPRRRKKYDEDRYRSDSYSPRPDPRDRYRRRSPSPHRDRSGRRGGYQEDSYSPRRHYSRSPPPRLSPWPYRQGRYSRSPDRRRRYSPSHSAPYSQSPSHEPRPKALRSPVLDKRKAETQPARAKSRSPSPMFDPYALHSRSPSPSSDEDSRPFTGKLQPLQSSVIADVKGFLSADADASNAEDRRAKKAAWRARQGLAPQDGADDSGRREMNDKQKLNRDYVVLMNKMKKGEGEGGAEPKA